MEVEELSKHDEARIQELFDRLDLDKDGKIDIKDLSNAFHQLGVPQIPGQAQVCRSRSRKRTAKILRTGLDIIVTRLLSKAKSIRMKNLS